MIDQNPPRALFDKGTFNGYYALIVVICILSIFCAYLLKWQVGAIPVSYFLPMHLVLEYAAVVVSFAVFITGWFGYKQTGNIRDVVLGLAFLASGAMDFIHTLSYKGMPDFLGTNTVGKAAAYYMVARLFVAAGLLTAAFIKPETRSRWLSAKAQLGFVMAMIAATIAVFTIYGSAVSNAIYNMEALRLTPLKVGMEYLIIMANAVAFFAISERNGWQERSVKNLRSAILFAIFAEYAFASYLSPYGWLNVLGHLLKTIAFYLILNSLFVTAIRKPYDELSQAKEELHALYLDAREHRNEIERSFARIGIALSSSLHLNEALDRISDLAVDMLHADCSVVAALDSIGKDIRVAVEKGTSHDVHRPMDTTLQIGKRAMDQMSSITIDDIQAAGLVDCDFSYPDCLRSVVCAPMIYEGKPKGVIAIYSHKAHAFESGDVKLLEAFASHAAVAVHNALSYERESRIADVLQRSILGTPDCVTDKFEIAHVYEPATNEALVGGDFYDIFETPDGKVAFAIGDVSGKGLKAAVHTAMVKYSLRAYVSEGHSPAETMRLLSNAVAYSTSYETFVTMFYGLLDPNTGELVYTNAGHEPPIYAYEGKMLTLPSNSPALGIGHAADFEEDKLILEQSSVLLLYTDGISEARRGHDFLGTEGICEQVLACQDYSGEDLAKCVYALAVEFAGGELKDDAAILAVRAR